MDVLEKRAAHISYHETHVLNIIILILAVLSVAGAGWMIISFAVCTLPSMPWDMTELISWKLFKALKTFRHQLVL